MWYQFTMEIPTNNKKYDDNRPNYYENRSGAQHGRLLKIAVLCRSQTGGLEAAGGWVPAGGGAQRPAGLVAASGRRISGNWMRGINLIEDLQTYQVPVINYRYQVINQIN